MSLFDSEKRLFGQLKRHRARKSSALFGLARILSNLLKLQVFQICFCLSGLLSTAFLALVLQRRLGQPGPALSQNPPNPLSSQSARAFLRLLDPILDKKAYALEIFFMNLKSYKRAQAASIN